MEQTIEQNLKALGVELPTPAAAAANYLPYQQSGNLVFTAGQLPLKDGKLLATGQVGAETNINAAQSAARQCAINVLAQIKAVANSLEHIEKIVKITVFVSSSEAFVEQHIVANGASDFLVEALGPAGQHARSAVGVPRLPMDASVEVEAIVELKA